MSNGPQLKGCNKDEVSNVVMGCMHLTELSKADARRLIETAIGQGVNFFDHADKYDNGEYAGDHRNDKTNAPYRLLQGLEHTAYEAGMVRGIYGGREYDSIISKKKRFRGKRNRFLLDESGRNLSPY